MALLAENNQFIRLRAMQLGYSIQNYVNLLFEEESFELLQDILEEAEELSKRAPYEELVTTTFAKEALR